MTNYVKKKNKKAASKRGENCPEIPEQLPHITVERRANGNRRNYFQHTLFPKPYPLIRTNPARPYDKTTGHFHSGSLTFKMTEQKENEKNVHTKKRRTFMGTPLYPVPVLSDTGYFI